MNDFAKLAASWAAGLVLGAFFFGGLWWTVRKSVSSPHPALWVFGSLLLRMTLVLAGFYWVAGGQWSRMTICLLGFLMARLMTTRMTRPFLTRQAGQTQEVSHGPNT